MFLWAWCLRRPDLCIACKCFYIGYCRIKCNKKRLIHVGPDTRAKGTYYLETKGVPPYALGMKGIINASIYDPSSFCGKIRRGYKFCSN